MILTIGDRTKIVLTVLTITLGTSWIGSSFIDELVFYYSTDKNGQYNEALGGYVTDRGGDMELANDFLKGANFWSTYASGQEVVENKFQPSGIDYIIHVLGDRQREDYIEKFHTVDFRYVSTIQKSFTDWECWVERANWFFYRELYRDWHPVFANQYQVYWERNQRDGAYTIKEGIKFEVVKENDSRIKLIVQTDEFVNGIADVYIDYDVREKDDLFLSKLMFRSLLSVRNTGTLSASSNDYELNYLRKQSAEYIPIPVVNGYGEVLLTAFPENTTYIALNSASCEAIYTSMAQNLQVVNLTDSNWENGVHRNGNILLFNYNEALLKRIEQVTTIGTIDHQYQILDVDYDDKYIRVQIDGDAKSCRYPYMLVFGDCWNG